MLSIDVALFFALYCCCVRRSQLMNGTGTAGAGTSTSSCITRLVSWTVLLVTAKKFKLRSFNWMTGKYLSLLRFAAHVRLFA